MYNLSATNKLQDGGTHWATLLIPLYIPVPKSPDPHDKNKTSQSVWCKMGLRRAQREAFYSVQLEPRDAQVIYNLFLFERSCWRSRREEVAGFPRTAIPRT